MHSTITDKIKSKKEETKKVSSFKDIVARDQQQPVKREVVKESKPEVTNTETPRYIKKQDGELIMHINRKSTYLNDMIDVDSENNK